MKQTKSQVRGVVALIGSSWFFRGIVALLVLQAAWIALTGRYPMAFDEEYHLGIIRLYAHHLSPFLGAQPPGTDSLGALSRDPSYLYHYLMSFPYRLVAAFTTDQTIQVLWLRVINIALFASALPLYRRLLLKTGASRAVVNTCLLMFVLVPVAPLLAAQVNYDNLLLPLVALILLLVADWTITLQQQKDFDGSRLAQIITLGLFTCLVKYPFLPIFLVVVAFLVVQIWRHYKSLPAFTSRLVTCVRKLAWQHKLLYIALFVLASVLCIERYGINLARYHTPVPDCAVVLSDERCNAYGPWQRDHFLQQHKVADGDSALDFAHEWLYGMWFRLFFAVDGPGTQFQTRGPLVIPAVSAIVGSILAVGLIVRYGQRLFTKYNSAVLALLAAVTVFYVAVLIGDGYEAYNRTGQPVAINGRYLLPILLPALLFSLLAASELLWRRTGIKVALAATMIGCLLWGGGALTYILRSHDTWYWPNDTVRAANHGVQRIVGPVVPGYNTPSEFLR